jgi:hypothetical protein
MSGSSLSQASFYPSSMQSVCHRQKVDIKAKQSFGPKSVNRPSDEMLEENLLVATQTQGKPPTRPRPLASIFSSVSCPEASLHTKMQRSGYERLLQTLSERRKTNCNKCKKRTTKSGTRDSNCSTLRRSCPCLTLPRRAVPRNPTVDFPILHLTRSIACVCG